MPYILCRKVHKLQCVGFVETRNNAHFTDRADVELSPKSKWNFVQKLREMCFVRPTCNEKSYFRELSV